MANAQTILEVLADPRRRALVEALRHGSLTVSELAKQVPVTRSAVSQHLRVLASANLVEHTAIGTRHHYRLKRQALGELRAYVSSLWDDALVGFQDDLRAKQRRAKSR